MLTVNKKQFSIFLILFVLCTPLFGVLTAPKAQAAGATGTWVDAGHIKVGNDIYIDPQVGDSMDYSIGGSGGCVNVIKGFKHDYSSMSDSDFANATLVTQTPNPVNTGDCQKKSQPITLSPVGNARILFRWVDAGTIESTTDSNVFKATADKPNVFIIQNSEDCKANVRPSSDTVATYYIGPAASQFGGECWADKNPQPAKIDPASAANRKKPAGTGTTTNSSSAASSGDDNSCESGGGALGWILCPVLDLMDGIMTRLDNAISNLLRIPDPYLNDDGIKAGWARLRNIAYVILVPIMLVMVISTALGFEFISAYTVKKAMPRLIAAVIFIALSYPICAFLIHMTNDIGGGVFGLITNIIKDPASGLTPGNITIANVFNPTGKDLAIGTVAGLATGAAILAVGSIGILFSYALVALIGIAIGFILLSLRQFIIIALVLFSPLAILAWIFPGNNKMWKLWWESFSKLLLLYPMIMVLLAAGRSFAVIVQKVAAAPGGSPFNGMTATLIKIIAYVGPYFFIPEAFKLAGGIFANVSGMANDRSRGLLDRQKKYRGQKMSENFGKTRNYSRFSDRNALTRGLNRTLGAGFNPRDLSKGTAGIRAGQRTGRVSQGATALKDDATFQANQGDDAFLLALANEDMAVQKINAAKNEYNTARASGDMDKMNSAQAEIDARSSALDTARRVTSRKSAGTRLTALNALAKTGYQFAPGEQGYKELSDTVTSIVGNDMGAYSSVMNEAQYHMKGAGRLDLAGINHGAGIDAKSGIRKLGNYQRGQGKPDTYFGGAQAWLGTGAVGADGKTAKSASEVMTGIQSSLAAGQTTHQDVAEWHSMLIRDKESATDANKIEIQKQIDAIEGLAGAYNSGPTPSTEAELNDRTSFVGSIQRNKQSMMRTGIDPSELDK